MSKLREFLAREGRIRTQSKELAALRSEVETLRTENERIKTAMRRCITCEFRLQNGAPPVGRESGRPDRRPLATPRER